MVRGLSFITLRHRHIGHNRLSLCRGNMAGAIQSADTLVTRVFGLWQW